MIERVSKQKETRYNQHHQSFHDEYMVNNSLKKGEWRDLYNTLLHDSIDLLIQKIAFEYELEESIVPNLKLSYKEWPNGRKTAKWHRLGFGNGKLLENWTITNKMVSQDNWNLPICPFMCFVKQEQWLKRTLHAILNSCYVAWIKSVSLSALKCILSIRTTRSIFIWIMQVVMEQIQQKKHMRRY